MAIIDLVSWTPQNAQMVYAWRYPQTNLSTYTQLLVNESQEAVLLSKGRLMGKFGPGKHTLDTENLPLLRSLFGLPFGGKNPFTAEVWFVNKVQTFAINWEAGSIMVHDSDYNTLVPIRAAGSYGLRVKDAEKFLVKLVGTASQFTQADMTRQFSGEFNTRAKSAVAKFMIQNHVGIKAISAYLDSISDFLAQQMSPFWDDLGIELTKFYVSEVDIDDSTAEGRSFKEAVSKQISMQITGHTWQQEQMFSTANNAIGNLGGSGNGSGNMLGTLLAINMMGGMGGNNGTAPMAGVAQGMMTPAYNQPTFGGPAPTPAPSPSPAPAPSAQSGVHQVYCANCSQRFPSSSRFCPHCGHTYNACPNCGSDNLDNARRCAGCGAPLTGAPAGSARCPGCNAPVAPGAAFCPSCGTRLTSSETCTRCGTPLAAGARFCPNCGNRR